MNFLANENFPRPSTIILRENGLSVKSIQEDFPGISDEEVIEIASKSNLIILTFDSDYGEIIFKYIKILTLFLTTLRTCKNLFQCTL